MRDYTTRVHRLDVWLRTPRNKEIQRLFMIALRRKLKSKNFVVRFHYHDGTPQAFNSSDSDIVCPHRQLVSIEYELRKCIEKEANAKAKQAQEGI